MAVGAEKGFHDFHLSVVMVIAVDDAVRTSSREAADDGRPTAPTGWSGSCPPARIQAALGARETYGGLLKNWQTFLYRFLAPSPPLLVINKSPSDF